MHLMISGRNCTDKSIGVPVLACTHTRNRLVPVVDFTHGYALIPVPNRHPCCCIIITIVIVALPQDGRR
jgi:hypothetical protein